MKEMELSVFAGNIAYVEIPMESTKIKTPTIFNN